MEPIFIGILAFASLIILIFLGVHIAIAMGVIGLVGLIIATNLDSALTLTVHSFFATASTYSFTVLPLFIIMGHFAATSGITEKAYIFASRWLSGLRAGLYLVTTGSCAMFAACTGSSSATAVAIGKTVLPEMERNGYDRKLSLGCVAASGTLGSLIPPSVIMVVYAIATEESIGRLLLAGVTPGILEAATYMAGVSLLVRLKPHLGPPGAKYTWRERFETIPGMWGVVLLFGIVIGGIYGGVFTPTEAGAWGAFAALVLVALRSRRRFFDNVKRAGWDTAVTTAMIFFVILAGIVFTKFLTLTGVVDAMVTFVTVGGYGPVTVLAMFIAINVLLGMFISATAAVILLAPVMHAILVPLGYDGVWLGVIMVRLFELAMITPPVGGNVFIAKALAPDVPLEGIFRGIAPFAVMDMINVVMLIVFPQISLWLPNLAFGR